MRQSNRIHSSNSNHLLSIYYVQGTVPGTEVVPLGHRRDKSPPIHITIVETKNSRQLNKIVTVNDKKERKQNRDIGRAFLGEVGYLRQDDQRRPFCEADTPMNTPASQEQRIPLMPAILVQPPTPSNWRVR